MEMTQNSNFIRVIVEVPKFNLFHCRINLEGVLVAFVSKTASSLLPETCCCCRATCCRHSLLGK